MTQLSYLLLNLMIHDIDVMKRHQTKCALRILASYKAKKALLDLLVYNSANNLYIQYPTKSPLAQRSIDVKSAAILTIYNVLVMCQHVVLL